MNNESRKNRKKKAYFFILLNLFVVVVKARIFVSFKLSDSNSCGFISKARC